MEMSAKRSTSLMAYRINASHNDLVGSVDWEHKGISAIGNKRQKKKRSTARVSSSFLQSIPYRLSYGNGGAPRIVLSVDR